MAHTCPSLHQRCLGKLTRLSMTPRCAGDTNNEQILVATGYIGRHGSRVVSVLDSGAVRPGFKSQPRRCRVTVLDKLLDCVTKGRLLGGAWVVGVA